MNYISLLTCHSHAIDVSYLSRGLLLPSDELSPKLHPVFCKDHLKASPLLDVYSFSHQFVRKVSKAVRELSLDFEAF